MSNLNIELFEQLRILLDENFDVLINTFIEDNTSRIEQLQLLIDAGQSEEVRHISHAMKSSSANIGALELSEICRQMEQDCVNNFTDVKTKYARLRTEFDALVLCLNENR
ncbi:MAG: Hpt domain-containing protein [Gammaproteobacteria bacterium]|nr:Hpt domain-containing protein [Gammaproteobacteria bacterium]